MDRNGFQLFRWNSFAHFSKALSLLWIRELAWSLTAQIAADGRGRNVGSVRPHAQPPVDGGMRYRKSRLSELAM